MRGQPAPAWDSGNSSVRQQYIDITFVVANSLILLITSAVGIAANIFVILAVYHQKSLQTWNNALVVNLAVVDILRCVIDCPILLVIVLTVYRSGRVDGFVCDTQVASFSFSCCIQLLSLACISAERYQAIAQPFKTSQRRRRIMFLIPATWTLAIAVAAFCLLFVKDSPVHVRCRGLQGEMLASYDTFGLYMLLPLWAACFAVIIGFYARIFMLVRSHNRKIFDKGTPFTKKDTQDEKQKKDEATAVKNGGDGAEQNQTLSENVPQVEPASQVEANSTKRDSTAALLTSTKAPQCASDDKTELKNTFQIIDLETEQQSSMLQPVEQVATNRDNKTFKAEPCGPRGDKPEAQPPNGDAATGVKSSATKPQKVSSKFDTENPSKERVKNNGTKEPGSHHVPSSAQLENPESTSVLLVVQNPAQSLSGAEAAAAPAEPSLPPASNNVPETEASKANMEVEGAVCMMPSKASKERASKKKESKMAKRAGYIIITFLLFWLPLITTILVNYVVYKNKNNKVSQDLECVMT